MIARSIRYHHADHDRLRNIPEALCAQVAQYQTLDAAAGPRDGGGAQDLVAAGAGGQTGRQVERRAKIPAVTFHDRALGDSHAHRKEVWLVHDRGTQASGGTNRRSRIACHDQQLIPDLLGDVRSI